MTVREILRQLDNDIDYFFMKYKIVDMHKHYLKNRSRTFISTAIRKEFGFSFNQLKVQDFADWYKELEKENYSIDTIANIMGITRGYVDEMRKKAGIFYYKMPQKSHKKELE